MSAAQDEARQAGHHASLAMQDAAQSLSMKSDVALEKGSSAADGALAFLTNNALSRSLASTYNAFQSRREALGLSNPGTVDDIAKEVQRGVFLNNLAFAGLRADLTKTTSVSPLFQVSHAFAQGSQQLPPYAFAAIYGSSTVIELLHTS
jgi:hypothetical protein